MPYLPLISDLEPFYIQTESDSSAVNVATAYGAVIQHQPFPEDYEVKDPYKNDFKDRHGDDEWVKKQYLKSFEWTVNFYMQTVGANPMAALVAQRDDLISKIRDGYFKIYDSWNRRGYQKVRFVSSKVDDDRKQIASDQARWVFSVMFKINDPLSRMTLSGGKIVEA